jgi:hypothetical protein
VKPSAEVKENRLGPMGFVLSFGVVSMLADVVYEGARAITGPYLATLGASAVMVGFITGFGEAVALVMRLGTGPLADRTKKYWPLTIAGYALTAVAVPLLAIAGSLWQASALVIAERFGKAVRTPARDTMLSHAGSKLGRGRAFAIHEAAVPPEPCRQRGADSPLSGAGRRCLVQGGRLGVELFRSRNVTP